MRTMQLGDPHCVRLIRCFSIIGPGLAITNTTARMLSCRFTPARHTSMYVSFKDLPSKNKIILKMLFTTCDQQHVSILSPCSEALRIQSIITLIQQTTRTTASKEKSDTEFCTNQSGQRTSFRHRVLYLVVDCTRLVMNIVMKFHSCLQIYVIFIHQYLQRLSRK